MASKKKSQPKNVPTITKQNKSTMTRTERKEEELKEELHIEEPNNNVLNNDDKENIKHQCERMINTKMLGTINSFMAKYAVLYRGKWLFVVYNRDKNRLVDFINLSDLTSTERNSFEVYKNRTELERRRQEFPPPPPIRPVMMVRQVPPPNGFAVDEDASE